MYTYCIHVRDISLLSPPFSFLAVLHVLPPFTLPSPLFFSLLSSLRYVYVHVHACRDLVGMRSPIIPLKGGKLPNVPTVEPWDGRDGQVRVAGIHLLILPC